MVHWQKRCFGNLFISIYDDFAVDQYLFLIIEIKLIVQMVGFYMKGCVE